MDSKTLEALRACHAWHVAEQNNIGTFQSRMELCSYSEHLVANLLFAADAPYSGVPRLSILPVEIQRCTEDNARELVAEVFAFIENGPEAK